MDELLPTDSQWSVEDRRALRTLLLLVAMGSLGDSDVGIFATRKPSLRSTLNVRESLAKCCTRVPRNLER
jgi:hypothetical protein